jgi:hypothetical protein
MRENALKKEKYILLWINFRARWEEVYFKTERVVLQEHL